MRNLILFLVIFLTCSCQVNHVYLRTNQQQTTKASIRIYLDRHGDFYPATAVPVVAGDFHIKGSSINHNAASLKQYFLASRAHINVLKKHYGITEKLSRTESFLEAQTSIITGYVHDIQSRLSSDSEKKVVLIIHGFNDPRPEKEYLRMREMIDSSQYAGATAKPVYVEVYWDGLTANGDSDELKIANIWQPAVFNSRWVGLSLRRLVNQVDSGSKVPFVIITHSLGAGVATGLLFNNKSKFWPNLFLAADLKKLMRVPTPTANIRLGMLAPAIPGILTFKDFNLRVPQRVITRAENNIEKIVVGYNELDYGVTKSIDGINFSPLYGSTTLGCNYFDPIKQHKEFVLVEDLLEKMGYTQSQLTRLWVPLEFKTQLRPDGKMREHIMPYYLSASPTIGMFLDDLFKN